MYWWVEHDVREVRRLRRDQKKERRAGKTIKEGRREEDEATGEVGGTVDIEGTAGADLPEEMSVRGLCEGLEEELSRVQILELAGRVLRDLGLDGDETEFLERIEMRLRERLEREEEESSVSCSSGGDRSKTSI